jgi:hypothetical protein
MNADDRRSIRYPLGLRCVFRLHEVVMEPSTGIIRDVSRQGCCIEAGDDVGRPADRLEIHFETPPGAPAGVIVGEVMQRQKTPLGWTLGVAFRNADPAVKWELLDIAYRHWQAHLASTARSDEAAVEEAPSQSP